jgi:hypothetical protein
MEAQEYMARKSKYEMIEMELAQKLVEEKTLSRFPLSILELNISGNLS